MNTATADGWRARIRTEGPIPLADFMAEAVAAYYRRPRVFGADGDFITAPEVSQIFGELIGLWLALRWVAMDRPRRFILAECGPGRGTLIADALRATAAIPDFLDAADLHLVETSPALRKAQKVALRGRAATWHDTPSSLPTGPLLLIANEFLDALPIRQSIFRNGVWRECQVGLDDADFVFIDGPPSAPPTAPRKLPPPAEGEVWEDSPATDAFIATIATRIAGNGGGALFFDYGHGESGYGDTLQAVSRHRFVSPLARPGEVDLTAHVDFARATRIASAHGATAFGPVTQGRWLTAMGLNERLNALLSRASPPQAAALASGARRLADPRAMGRLFKALAILPPEPMAPEGF